jgi:hypothetical protein
MLQFILATVVAVCAQVPEPPADRQVLATLPETDAVRTQVSITKAPVKTADGTVWTCIAYYTESRDGVPVLRLHVVYLGTGRTDVWDTPALPRPDPARR